MITQAQLLGIKTSIASALEMSDVKHLLTKERKEQIASSLTFFCIKAVEKYLRGQEEHGGDLADRNLDAEIEAEIIDLMFYNMATKWK